MFQPLFLKELPELWDPDGKLIPHDKYVELLNQVRAYHSKFDGLHKGLKGEIIVNKLSDDFELLIH